MNYPNNVIQSFVNNWWTTDTSKNIVLGRLIWAYLPHVDQIPYEIVPIGRSGEDHSAADFRFQTVNFSRPKQAVDLPVAGLPFFQSEIWGVYRTKKRPAIVISVGGPDIPRALRENKPRSLTIPAILVIPYYTGSGKGFSSAFIERVKMAEYPNFMWDNLPFNKKPEDSILRLNHIQPVGRHSKSIECTDYCLSGDALEIVSEWIDWLFYEALYDDGFIATFRGENLKHD